MFVRTVSKRGLLSTVYTLALLAGGLLLLYRPQAVSTGISRGLSVCTGVIIPTLYPFMLLAGLLADSPLCRRPGRFTQALTRRLFGLPGCCGPAILLSLVGGYPAGGVAIGQLRKQGLLQPEQVSRLTAFCVCGGPGFIVSTVGAGLLGSVTAGLLLYAAQVVVSLAIGIWLGRGHRREPDSAVPVAAAPRSIAAVVADTCGALLTMCGFVVLAATTLSLSEALGLPRGLAAVSGAEARHWSALLAATAEVSCGCIALAGSGPMVPFFLSVALSWAGLSVQGQLAAALPGHRLFTPTFWGWRLLHGALSGGVACVLFSLFPTALSTMAGGHWQLHQVSPAASLMLLLLSFLAMVCFSAKKTGNMAQSVIE